MTDKSDQIAAAIIERVTGEKPMTQKELTRRGTTQEIAALRVGDTLWSFDSNRRVYRSGVGLSGGGPIYREHYQQETIVGETPLSWLVGASPPTKVNKKTLACRTEYGFGGYFTKSAMEDRIWINENRPALIRALEYSHDADLLRAVDRLVKNAIS